MTNGGRAWPAKIKIARRIAKRARGSIARTDRVPDKMPETEARPSFITRGAEPAQTDRQHEHDALAANPYGWTECGIRSRNLSGLVIRAADRRGAGLGHTGTGKLVRPGTFSGQVLEWPADRGASEK